MFLITLAHIVKENRLSRFDFHKVKGVAAGALNLQTLLTIRGQLNIRVDAYIKVSWRIKTLTYMDLVIFKKGIFCMKPSISVCVSMSVGRKWLTLEEHEAFEKLENFSC